jgi:hypothetical protein
MISFRPTGELKYEVEVHYIEDPVLGYRPARATAVTFRGGHVRQQRYLDVHSVVLNPPFSDSDFQLTFPAGTRVYDERTNNEYVAGELTLATRENQDVAAPAQQIAPVAGPPVNGGPATSERRRPSQGIDPASRASKNGRIWPETIGSEHSRRNRTKQASNARQMPSGAGQPDAQPRSDVHSVWLSARVASLFQSTSRLNFAARKRSIVVFP